MKEREVSLDYAVRHIMKATGRTRRQAEQRLLQALKSGEVRVTGNPVVRDEDGNEEILAREPIPPELFRGIPSEH